MKGHAAAMQAHEWAVLALAAAGGLYVLHAAAAQPPPPPPPRPQPWRLHATRDELACTQEAFEKRDSCPQVPLPDGLGPLLGVLAAPLEPGQADKIANPRAIGVWTRHIRRGAVPVRALLHPDHNSDDLYVITLLHEPRTGLAHLWLRCRFRRHLAIAPYPPRENASDGAVKVHSTIHIAGDEIGWLHVWPDDARAQAQLIAALRHGDTGL